MTYGEQQHERDVPIPEAMGTRMEGRRVRLEPLRPRHIDSIHTLACSSAWPFAGANLPMEQFVPYMSTAWARPFVALRTDTGHFIGVIIGAEEDLRNQTIAVAVALKPEVWGAVWPIEAVILYLRYLFEGCNFRKVYLDMTESAHDRWGGRIDRWASVEARSGEHARNGDRFEDVLRFAMYREQWDSSRLAERILGGNPSPGGPA